MDKPSQILQAKAHAENVVADVHRATLGNPIFVIQVLGIACGMAMSSAIRQGFGEPARDALVKSQSMGLDWQGTPSDVLKP